MRTKNLLFSFERSAQVDTSAGLNSPPSHDSAEIRVKTFRFFFSFFLSLGGPLHDLQIWFESPHKLRRKSLAKPKLK